MGPMNNKWVDKKANFEVIAKNLNASDWNLWPLMISPKYFIFCFYSGPKWRKQCGPFTCFRLIRSLIWIWWHKFGRNVLVLMHVQQCHFEDSNKSTRTGSRIMFYMRLALSLSRAKHWSFEGSGMNTKVSTLAMKMHTMHWLAQGWVYGWRDLCCAVGWNTGQVYNGKINSQFQSRRMGDERNAYFSPSKHPTGFTGPVLSW